MRKISGKIFFQYVVNISSLIALILQLIDTPDKGQSFTAKIVIFLLIVNLIIFVIGGNKYRKKRLIKKSKKLMKNATESVVMFGGDLSWTNDYKVTIQTLTNNGKIVEVMFPEPKIKDFNTSAKNRFNENIKTLMDIGVKVYYTEEDFKLRCTIIDRDSRYPEDMKVISSKRISYHERDKHKYRVHFYQNCKDSEKDFCNLYQDVYISMKKHRKEYI